MKYIQFGSPRDVAHEIVGDVDLLSFRYYALPVGTFGPRTSGNAACAPKPAKSGGVLKKTLSPNVQSKSVKS